MTDEQLAEWKSACDVATPGPWRVKSLAYKNAQTGREGTHFWIVTGKNDVTLPMDTAADSRAIANAALLSIVREAMPALIAEVRRLRRALDNLGD